MLSRGCLTPGTVSILTNLAPTGECADYQYFRVDTICDNCGGRFTANSGMCSTATVTMGMAAGATMVLVNQLKGSNALTTACRGGAFVSNATAMARLAYISCYGAKKHEG